MKVNVSFKGEMFARDIVVADSFWLKLTGYMFRSKPHVNGFLFDTNSIQTTFMNFDLDLVFLDRNGEVVKIIRNIKPWRFTRFYLRAKKTLEVPAGQIPLALKEGDSLEVTHV